MKTVPVFFLIILIVCLAVGCNGNKPAEVVIYTSVDQIFSEPILKEYEKETGVKVKVVYDVEASKTTGLVNRLIAEKDNPKCDVFWNSEIGRTITLKNEGVLTTYHSPVAKEIPELFKDRNGYWTGFAARARVLVYNTNLLSETDLPKSIFELTDPKWKGRVAMAYPLFGTSATHVAALYSSLGQEKTEAFLRALQANDVVIVQGNSTARDMVVDGSVPLAFTDTDDVNVAIQSGKTVKMIYPDKGGMGTLLIPNTVALIANGPNPEEGKKLMDHLLSKAVESKLSESESANMPLRDGVKTPANVPEYNSVTAMSVDYHKVAEEMTRSAKFCQALFVR